MHLQMQKDNNGKLVALTGDADKDHLFAAQSTPLGELVDACGDVVSLCVAFNHAVPHDIGTIEDTVSRCADLREARALVRSRFGKALVEARFAHPNPTTYRLLLAALEEVCELPAEEQQDGAQEEGYVRMVKRRRIDDLL